MVFEDTRGRDCSLFPSYEEGGRGGVLPNMELLDPVGMHLRRSGYIIPFDEKFTCLTIIPRREIQYNADFFTYILLRLHLASEGREMGI